VFQIQFLYFQSTQIDPGCAKKFPSTGLLFGCNRFSSQNIGETQDLTRSWFFLNISNLLIGKNQNNVETDLMLQKILLKNSLQLCWISVKLYAQIFMKKDKKQARFSFWEKIHLFTYTTHKNRKNIRIETRDKNIFGLTKTDTNY